MKKSTISKQWSNTTDLISTLAVKSHKLSTLWLMLFTLLFVPTRMVAQTTTEVFNSLDGITDVTITDNGSYPWQELDLNAKGMEKVSSYFTKESKGLMSGNYNKSNTTSETVIEFNVEKSILFSFKYLVSSEQKWDVFTITLDGKKLEGISGTSQNEYKRILSVGKHSLTLSYKKDQSTNKGADRAFIYDLKTSTTIDGYVAEYDATNYTLTFKKIASINSEPIDLNRIVMVNNKQTVINLCSLLGIKIGNIKNVIFEESFNTYTPTSLKEFFRDCTGLNEITGLKYLNTAEVTDMSFMFWNCRNLSSLDLTNFNTAKVTDMSSMFKYCQVLSSLNLSNFNTAEVENMFGMFSGCSMLQTIYVSDNFVTTKVSSGADMFSGCDKLNGFIDYINNTDKTDHDYANYKTDYFTKLVVSNGDERYGITGETTKLTVDNLALDDDKDFVAYEPFAATAVTYSRTIKAGTTWATLCLPFEVTLEGKNFRAFNLLSADEGTGTIELEEIKTSIAAGTPVIIKMKEGATELNFSEADMPIAKDVQTLKTADGNYQLQGIYTQKVFDKEADNNCYIVKGDKLMNPAKLLENTNNKTVGSKPFRAYMVDKSSAPAAGAKMFSIGFDNDSTTAIDTLNTIANDKAEYYDLQGKRLNEPQKGINIVKRGGKTMKVIIK